MSDYNIIGKSMPRVDARAKVTGGAMYSADLKFPRMLVGKILRSPFPHARILNIDTSKAKALPGVKSVVTGKDTYGQKWGVFRYTQDQQFLVTDKARYIGDEVAALAAVDEDTALEALDPLCDKGASEFSTQFYQTIDKKLKSEQVNIAKVLRELRKQFMENGDPTFLAYIFYGDPHLSFMYDSR